MSLTEQVRAEEVRVGDTLVVPGAVATVSQVQEFWLASPVSDKTIPTSSPPSHRWPVIHLQLAGYAGIVRFKHEHVTRYVR